MAPMLASGARDRARTNPQRVILLPVVTRRSAGPRVRVAEDEGQRALLVDGVVQSVAVEGPVLGPGYWPAMLPDARPRRALLLGLGAGTIAHLLVRRFGPVAMVGVESDAE